MRYLMTVVLLCIAMTMVGCGDFNKATVASQLMSTGGSLEDVESVDAQWGPYAYDIGELRLHIHYVETAENQPNQNEHYVEKIQQIDRILKEVQDFFANEMERHGHGKKTFKVVTRFDGIADVRKLVLPRSTAEYGQGGFYMLESDILRRAKPNANGRTINVFFLDTIPILLACGYGGGHGTGGNAYIFNTCWKWKVVAHEIGHTMGLWHDFRDDSFIMSYGSRRRRLSAGAAEWLNRHRAFNHGGFDIFWGLPNLKINIINIDELIFEFRFLDNNRGIAAYQDFIRSYDYAVLFDNSGWRRVIAFTDNITQIHTGNDHEPFPERVYTLDFEGEFPDDVNAFRIQMMGSYGQIDGGADPIPMPK